MAWLAPGGPGEASRRPPKLASPGNGAECGPGHPLTARARRVTPRARRRVRGAALPGRPARARRVTPRERRRVRVALLRARTRARTKEAPRHLVGEALSGRLHTVSS